MNERHLLDIDRLADDDIEHILNRACGLAAGGDAAAIKATVANLFYEPSTRTRVSFELAAGRLGMRVVNIELDHSSATKGETLEDTAATLAAMGVDGVVLRHPESHRVSQLADVVSGLRLINAGDGTHAHPSQALLDAAVLRARGVDFSGLKLAVVGDIRHSRVAGSGIRLWQRLGVSEIRLAGPDSLLPANPPVPSASLHDNLADAVRGADVVMMLRVQHERMDRAGWPDRESYFADWGLKEDDLADAAPGCLVMHPGPINRGMEIDATVADGERSLILEQVRMGVFARMAIFEWLFGE
ncbi:MULTISPECIES: aspartate carbamoyltransferase catalytic subunit [unclassified Wenzhouxiangella]|uniref:aspartate carbamoyltransferase catalytic subunit n=1 Tax=unclassified Wenzhouxiangella TaxID=2613841 RepID=UPI000E3275CD|nr:MULTISPECIES: aspartate carbamoyltransferase catalytic subunit [unclassified Wenzhouxiangella]RFF28365.1 aspartate carbamoyltransferase catalytic subunit [Wenzhouxiangella sp. 15181]RFP69882.1 aspartate carbamoyltransferase catalytic subunit [Wenzhouxiangella sp. 15190]